MSVPPKVHKAESPSLKAFTQAAIPVVIAAAAVALVVLAVRSEPLVVDEIGAEASAEPTPYSEMHARVQHGPGMPEELPATF